MTVHTIPVFEIEENGYRDETLVVPDASSRTLLQRLGVSALPAHETLYVAEERLLVSEAKDSLRAAKRLVKSIQQVGLLQSPSVVLQSGRTIHDPDTTFSVIAGRRRVLAARLAGLPVIKCEVYASSSLPLSSLLALIENTQRSAAWVQEVGALRQLMDEKVGLTMDDLAHFGFDRVHLAERLKIAQLPAPLLHQVLAGTMSRDVARKLVRLTSSQQERVVQLAENGEEVTADLVKETLRVQIAGGLLPLQKTLAQSGSQFEGHGSSVLSLMASSPDTFPSKSARNESVHAGSVMTEVQPGNMTSPPHGYALHEVFQALLIFQQSDAYRTVPRAVQTLIEALAQELRLTLRTPSAMVAEAACDSPYDGNDHNE